MLRQYHLKILDCLNDTKSFANRGFFLDSFDKLCTHSKGK